MKIAIIGYNGKVAEASYFYLQKAFPDAVIKIYSQSIGEDINLNTINICDKKTLKQNLFDFAPNVIINCVAMTDVDGCEVEKKLSRDLNTILVENLTNISKILEAHFITFSTDFIFNGKKGLYDEDDRPEPLSFYGKTKLAAENYVVTNYNKYTIIRTNLVFGYSKTNKPSFVGWLYDSLSTNKEINIVESLWGNPTHSIDLAEGVIRAIQKKSYGIYNISGGTYNNRYELALEVAKYLNKDVNLIKKIDLKDLKQKAHRPEKGGLSNSKAEKELGLKIPTLQESLALYTKCIEIKGFV